MASLFVLYDMIYFVYIIYVRLRGGEDNKSLIRFCYTILAGFPFGSVGKILTGLWYDEYLSLTNAFYPYAMTFSILSYIAGGIACIIGFLLVLFCCCSKGKNVDGKSLGIVLLVGLVFFGVSATCVGFFAGFENIIYLGSGEKVSVRGFFKTRPDPSFPAWTRTFAVIWVPMGLLFEVSFWNAVRKGKTRSLSLYENLILF